jgi:two-component system, cell cycle response regulator DivK
MESHTAEEGRKEAMAGAPILVVDDAPINLRLIRMLFTHEGYEVRTAERAEEALEMLSSYRPELILADVQLNGMDGLEMTRKIKEDPRTNAIRVVAFSAHSSSESRERAIHAGCEDYICKPIDTTALAARVRELLARPQARKSTAAIEAKPEYGALLDFSAREIESLRRRFLSEGVDRSRQLLDDLDGAIDSARAASQLHQWAGSAALLGYPGIGALAGSGETLLGQEPMDLPKLREILTDLLLAFTEIHGEKVEPPQKALLDATAGKHVALIGFPSRQADLMCAVLGRLKALPLLFEASDPANSQAIANCDVAAVYVRRDTLESAWLKPGTPAQSPVKLVYMGAQRDLMALSPEVRARAVDVLVDREDRDEILMRLAFAISHRGPEPAEPAGPPPLAVTPGLPAAPRLAVASPTVVLADDDDIVLALATAMLKNHGMACKSASNGHDALKLIRSERPHAAVLDVNMPGMTGFEVLAEIRKENLPVRVILLTARQQEDDILRAFRLGADDYVTKPFSTFELVARVKRFLE